LQFEIKIYVNFILDVNYLEKQYIIKQYIIKQLLDEVFVISEIIKVEVSVKPKAEADNTYRDLDNFGYHKNLIQ
jgi:hypothetical protein